MMPASPNCVVVLPRISPMKLDSSAGGGGGAAFFTGAVGVTRGCATATGSSHRRRCDLLLFGLLLGLRACLALNFERLLNGLVGFLQLGRAFLFFLQRTLLGGRLVSLRSSRCGGRSLVVRTPNLQLIATGLGRGALVVDLRRDLAASGRGRWRCGNRCRSRRLCKAAAILSEVGALGGDFLARVRPGHVRRVRIGRNRQLRSGLEQIHVLIDERVGIGAEQCDQHLVQRRGTAILIGDLAKRVARLDRIAPT